MNGANQAPSRGANGGLLAEEEVTLLELSNELEEVTGRMRRAVIDMVHRARDRLHEAAARELEMRRAAQDLEQQQLIEQLDNMQALNVKHAQDMEDKEIFCDKLLAILFRLRGVNKERTLKRRCLRAWHSIISRDRWVDCMGGYLGTQRDRLLCRRVLHAWRNDAGRSSRDRRLATINALHEAEMQRVKADAELTNSAMRVELLGYKDQVARGNEEKAILQERLKSHLMRGMCALNAESTMLLRSMSMPENAMVFPPVAGMQQQQAQAQENVMPGQQHQQYFTSPFGVAPGGAASAFNRVNVNNNINSSGRPSAFPEYGGAAGQGSSATDGLLAMQASINAQLNGLSAMPEGYVPGQHSVNFGLNNSTAVGAVANNNNNSSGGGGARPPQSTGSNRGTPVTHASPVVVGATAGNSLVSFNNSHPAVRSQQNSGRSTPTTLRR